MKHLTQEQIAEIVELSTVYIDQIERGERKLILDTLAKLANALNVSVGLLLRDSVVNQTEMLDNELTGLLRNRTCEAVNPKLRPRG